MTVEELKHKLEDENPEAIVVMEDDDGDCFEIVNITPGYKRPTGMIFTKRKLSETSIPAVLIG